MVLKDHFLQSQEQSILKSRKSSQGVRRPTRMNKLFLTKLRHQKEVYRRWEQDEVTWEKYTSTV